MAKGRIGLDIGSTAVRAAELSAGTQPTVDRAGDAGTIEVHGRHDPTVLPRLVPVAEAMLALVVMEHALRQRAQCGDVSEGEPSTSAGSQSPQASFL